MQKELGLRVRGASSRECRASLSRPPARAFVPAPVWFAPDAVV